MTLDDLEQLWVRIFSEFVVTWQICEPTTAKQINKIEPYC